MDSLILRILEEFGRLSGYLVNRMSILTGVQIGDGMQDLIGGITNLGANIERFNI